MTVEDTEGDEVEGGEEGVDVGAVEKYEADYWVGCEKECGAEYGCEYDVCCWAGDGGFAHDFFVDEGAAYHYCAWRDEFEKW